MNLLAVIKKGFGIVAFLVITTSHNAFSTHLRAGEITVERLSCQELTFRITITVFTDIGPGITAKFGNGILDFDDGTFVEVPLNENPQDLGNDVGFNQFIIDHTFNANGIYNITYTEPNRNEGILNMTNSVNTPFHLETKIIIDPFLGCNSTPVLLVPPVDRGCTGSAFYHNPGAFDFEGDSLSYEFVTPKQDNDLEVIDYIFPHEVESGTNEDGTGPATLTLDPITGDIIWDAPVIDGEYNIAFIVKEWRIVDGIAFQLGSVRRDMQIIIEECDNDRPEIQVPEDVCVVAGEVINEQIVGIDPDGDPVKLEAFGGVFEVEPVATVNPDPPVFQPNPAVLDFEWQTSCTHVRQQPYQVEFKASDSSSQGPTLVEFGTWSITVVGPPPVLQSADLNLATGRKIDLLWDPYTCTNAEKIQIWRRVDSFSYTPEECETGIRETAGYSLVAEVPSMDSKFTDSNLAAGAKYCYRLVAVFPFPGGGESIVSNEICADPIEADAPVITHVTVDETDMENGEITISWRSPFEISQAQFPPPYTYELVRARGLSGEQELTVVTTTTDTTFTDTGLNTEDNAYNYRVRLFDSNNSPVDTSAVASSVWLEPEPLFEKIELNWEAEVPWSNNVQDFPYHYIYRDNSDPSNPDALILIDSVNVNEDGFVYLDEGQFNDVPLEQTTLYCYFVTTFGSYGNPLIEEPQKNNSQIICTQPNDTLPPCAPVLSLDVVDCEEFLVTESCRFNDFSNTLFWDELDEEGCGEDIGSFNIYFSSTGREEDFTLVENVTDSFFVHDNLPSFKGCYRITAVDRSGNESEFSETVCNDNCPNYVLPNVFTPNGDLKNDVFMAFNDRAGGVDENNPDNPVSLDPSLCPRFVENVKLTIYNRWGKEVFSESFNIITGREESFMKWDGRNNDGNPVSTGVYYYVAEVTFDMLNPSNRVQKINGWVQLLR